MYFAIVGVLLAILFYFAWSYIHEMSHIVAAKLTVGLVKYELKIFPHNDPIVGWRWASCKYWHTKEPSEKQAALICMAPRIPDVAASIAFALSGCFMTISPFAVLVWATFWGTGVIDLITGSLGASEHSDLQKAFKSNAHRWFFRVAGITIAISSIICAAFSIFGG